MENNKHRGRHHDNRSDSESSDRKNYGRYKSEKQAHHHKGHVSRKSKTIRKRSQKQQNHRGGKISFTSQNPFINFFRDYKKKHPDLSIVELASQIAKLWNNMSGKQKLRYAIPNRQDSEEMTEEAMQKALKLKEKKLKEDVQLALKRRFSDKISMSSDDNSDYQNDV